VPELLNSAISAVMAAMSFFPALYSAAALLVDGVGDGSIVDCRLTAAILSLTFIQLPQERLVLPLPSRFHFQISRR